MKKYLNEIILQLSKTTFEGINNFIDNVNETSFICRDVKCVLVKELIMYPNESVGKITVYNYMRTPINGTNYKKIENFDLLVYHSQKILIKNYENQKNSLHGLSINSHGYVETSLTNIATDFYSKLETKLFNSNIALSVF